MDIQPGWLTSAVLQDYKRSIDFASLPQTIKDAVIVAKGLHIRHLWVDSLCIIQDDEMDKDREIGQMGSIYERSAITILASRAASVTEGFLNPKIVYERKDIPWVLDVGGDIGTRRSDGNITTSRSIVLAPPDSCFVSHDGPLTLRGWALQERLLSHRTINFALSEITWGGGNYTRPASFRERHKHSLVSSLPPRFTSEDHFKFWHDCWAGLVMEYTKLTLRYARDRLPALAGIAQSWGENFDDSYVSYFNFSALRSSNSPLLNLQI